MKIIEIDASDIINWKSFHETFQRALGFPDFYGNNMNAWNDCMTYIDDPESGMTSINIDVGSTLIINLINSDKFKTNCKEQFEALLECTAFVNKRKIDDGTNTIIAIACY